MPPSYGNYTPDDVLALSRPTEGFLCPISANVYNIEFLSFTIMDYETKRVIFEVGRDTGAPPPQIDLGSLDENVYRRIQYKWSEDVLRLPSIATSLVFSIGDREVPDFRMVERHYFKDRLIKSYDFTFGFCIPGSTNTWDAVYAVPPLKEDLIEEMVANPYKYQSDSFYFVGDKMIMHNKAEYEIMREDPDARAQSKGGYDDDDDDYKGSKGGGGGGSKAGAKGSKGGFDSDDDDDGPWSKETDYYDD